jgi:hypothetical protein
MTAPLLRSLDTLPPAVLRQLPPLPREGVEVFVVTAEGSLGSRRFAAGDLLVCRGPARQGDATVLVARGHGRPRLGSVEGTRFRGDAGEPCHPSRWRAAGALVARYRRGAHGWVVELLERQARPATVSGELLQVSAAAEVRGERSSAAQLPLFAA